MADTDPTSRKTRRESLMPASNTRECFEEFVGQRVTGVLFSALPRRDRSIAAGTKTLIFEDGRGLTISSKGTFWIDSATEVDAAVDETRRELERTKRNLEAVLEVAGRSA